MSSFIVEKSTIDKVVALAHGFIKERIYMPTLFKDARDGDAMGAKMIELNHMAYDYRYSVKTEGESYDYPLKKYSLVECIKACDCWMYQCSESDKLMNSDIFKQVEELANNARRALISTLPEYQNAVWG